MSKIKLFNTSTNKAESVDHDKVDELIASGAYEFVPGSTVDVVNPEGQAGTISSKEAAQAIAAGFKYDTAKMRAERKIMEEYGDKPVEAGLASFLRGTTMQASDVVLTGLGVEPEHLRRLEEANPAVSMVGEGLGMVTGLVGSGGTGAAAKTAGLATKAVTGAGKIAERAVAGGLKHAGVDASKSLAQKIVANTAPTVAQGAVEGAIIGAGDVVSEHALGRTDLNAENLMAAGGLGAVIGGSGNLLFKGMEVAVPRMLKTAKGAGNYVQKRFGSSERAALDMYGVPEAKVAQLARDGVAPSEVAELTMRDYVPEAGKDFLTHFDSVNAARTEKLRMAYENADNVLGGTVSLNQVLDKNKYIDKIQKAIDDIAPHAPRQQIRELRDLKRNLEKDELLYKRPEMRMDADGIEKRVLVTDESVGPMQSFKRILDKVDEMAKHDSLARPTKKQELAGELRKELRDDLNTALENIAKNNPDLDPNVANVFKEIRQLNRDAYVSIKLQPFVDRMDAKQFTEKFFNFRTIVGAAAGGAAFGVEGAITALAIKLANMPAAQLVKLRALSKIEKEAVKVQSRLNASIDQFMKVGKKVPRLDLGVKKTLIDASYDPEPKKKRDETREEALKRISNELSSLESFEAKTALLEKRLETLNEVAPETAAELSAKITNGIEFLRAKLPVDPKEGGYINPAFSRWKPSRLQLDKFERYVAAVEDPLSVIEGFGRGVVDREGIETLQVVYPELYTQLQTSVLDRVYSMKEPLPYKKRLELKSVLGINLDPALQPEKVAMLQDSFTPVPMPQSQQPGRTAPNAPRGKLQNNALATETESLLTTSELA